MKRVCLFNTFAKFSHALWLNEMNTICRVLALPLRHHIEHDLIKNEIGEGIVVDDDIFLKGLLSFIGGHYILP